MVPIAAVVGSVEALAHQLLVVRQHDVIQTQVDSHQLGLLIQQLPIRHFHRHIGTLHLRRIPVAGTTTANTGRLHQWQPRLSGSEMRVIQPVTETRLPDGGEGKGCDGIRIPNSHIVRLIKRLHKSIEVNIQRITTRSLRIISRRALVRSSKQGSRHRRLRS
ncbi:hypothetical protein AL705_04960 [Lawsonella clevelandensis]|uniref:Uncharacterized protein n=1 Tax=Lawsonella clevelandensis TaxID=1528099 RepID=A0A0M3TBK8_9ACTN|nr:hypothetical protein AL705_04960 [Lawsonella clevelandensis]